MEFSSAPGRIGWIDLTVPEATKVRDFYRDVVGWTSESLSLGEYNDYVMTPPGAETPIAGVCHARGSNASVPPVWLIYVNVPDLDASLAKCVACGGSIVDGPRSMGGMGQFAAI